MGQGGHFGIVSVSGGTLVVGTPGDTSTATGVDSDPSGAAYEAGAAYVYRLTPPHTAPPSPGRIVASINPAGPIHVGDDVTVTLSIRDYTELTEIDKFDFNVFYPSALFSVADVSFNDADGANANWLRLPPQDGVGVGALPLIITSELGRGIWNISVADQRPSSVRGTAAGNGFLLSFVLHAVATGTGSITPRAPLLVSGDNGPVLYDLHGSAAGVPSFSGASITVVPPEVVIPPVPGRIIGRIDMLGEEEVAIPNPLRSTQVLARNGPAGEGQHVILPPPYYGGFILGGLLPSSAETPPKGYEVGAALNIRDGRRLETFIAPSRGAGNE